MNAIPTSRGLNSCQDQHSCRADPRAGPSGPALGSRPDPRVHTRPLGWYRLCIISRCVTCSDHYPISNTGSFNCLSWLGGGTERKVMGEDCWWEGAKERGRGLCDLGGQAVHRLCRVTVHCRWEGVPAPPDWGSPT